MLAGMSRSWRARSRHLSRSFAFCWGSSLAAASTLVAAMTVAWAGWCANACGGVCLAAPGSEGYLQALLYDGLRGGHDILLVCPRGKLQPARLGDGDFLMNDVLGLRGRSCGFGPKCLMGRRLQALQVCAAVGAWGFSLRGEGLGSGSGSRGGRVA